jgi:hypothetical protein
MQNTSVERARLVWTEFVAALMGAFDDTVTYAAMDKKARNLKYEKLQWRVKLLLLNNGTLGQNEDNRLGEKDDVPTRRLAQGVNQTTAFVEPQGANRR